MLDERLTLLDGTDVCTLGVAAVDHDLTYREIHDAVSSASVVPATVLDGVRYYTVSDIATAIASTQ